MTTAEKIGGKTPQAWLQAQGDAFVVLSMDLAAFVQDQSLETIEQVRGQAYFDRFLENLPNQLKTKTFEVDSQYKQIEQRGFILGIFNRILAEDNFAPTYRLRKEQIKFPAHLENNVQFNDKFVKAWKKWECYLRLSSNGIITLILHLPISQFRKVELICLDVMGLRDQFDIEEANHKIEDLQKEYASAETEEARSQAQARIDSVQQLIRWVQERSMTTLEDEHSPVVWQIAVEVAKRFVEEGCHSLLSIPNDQGKPLLLQLRNRVRRDALREHFTVYLFNEIRDNYIKPSSQSNLSPCEIREKPEYLQTVSGLLEGVMLHGKAAYTFPAREPNEIERIAANDLSTWRDEICFIADSAAVIYYRLPRSRWTVAFSTSKEIEYKEYWQSLFRLLEFGVEVKLMALLLEQSTFSSLSSALQFTNVSVKTTRLIEQMISRMVNASRLLAHLRSLTVVPIVGHAGYAVRKYEQMLLQMGVPHILSHIELNLQDSTRLLQRHFDLNIQTEAQRINTVALSFSLVFASLSLAFGVLALPSFLVDWSQGADVIPPWIYPMLGNLGLGIVGLLVVMSIAMLIIATTIFLRLMLDRRRLL